MRIFFVSYLFLVLVCFHATAQYFSTSTGVVSFFSKTPIEDISATHKTASSIINTANNQIAVQIAIKQFTFPNALMQEHFNENYMESEKYPQATFAGKINEKIDFTVLGVYPVTATGKLKMHGVEQDKTLKGTLEVTATGIILKADFEVALADYKIDIPKIVFAKIAEKIQVKIDFLYVAKK
jgi:polyisoprenoid-binding protein YceI